MYDMSFSRSKKNHNVIFECQQILKKWQVEKKFISKYNALIFF